MTCILTVKLGGCMGLNFIVDYPAIILGNYLIIGDLHIGIESDVKGRTPNGAAKVIEINRIIEEMILNIKDRFKNAKHIIVLGDIKEDIYAVSPKVYRFIDFLKDNFEDIAIVKGNHDANIETIPGIKVYPSTGFTLEFQKKRYGFVHGHSWPDETLMLSDYIISAHQHMHLKITDEQGKVYTKKVWIITKRINKKNAMKKYKRINEKLKMIIMPAFNPLIIGTEITENGLGPLFNNGIFDLKEAEMYSLSGIFMGKINNLLGQY